MEEMDLDPSLAFTAQLEVRPGLADGAAWRGALLGAWYEQEKVRNMMDFARQYAKEEDEFLAEGAAAGAPLRRASIARSSSGRPGYREVTAYLPGNYRVTGVAEKTVTITGFDNAGWTMDSYVIPRLASGMIFATETAA